MRNVWICGYTIDDNTQGIKSNWRAIKICVSVCDEKVCCWYWGLIFENVNQFIFRLCLLSHFGRFFFFFLFILVRMRRDDYVVDID